MTTRPYRVGTARPEQRYIEPTEIYEDLRSGPSTQIPRAFPYSWTPVNGLSLSSSNPIDDLFNAGKTVVHDVVKSGSDAVKDQAGKSAEDLINDSPGGKALLDAIKAKAQEGVVEEVKKNAPNLMLFAVAGGAVGGAVAAKLGKIGTIGAIGLAVWAGWQLMHPAPPAVKK